VSSGATAALAAGGSLPEGLGTQRLARALAGLERDGLVERAPHGWALPR
jgi:DNA-binding HxlR family transcriptional regulator